MSSQTQYIHPTTGQLVNKPVCSHCKPINNNGLLAKLPNSVKYLAGAALFSGISYFGYLCYQRQQYKRNLNNSANNNNTNKTSNTRASVPQFTSTLNSSPLYPSIIANDPADLDGLITELEAKKRPSTRLYCYVTAAHSLDTNQPWCPDSRASNPIIDSELTKQFNNVMIIECPVIRDEWKSTNIIHPYKSGLLKTQRIPTLFRINNHTVTGALVENDCKDPKLVADFLSK